MRERMKWTSVSQPLLKYREENEYERGEEVEKAMASRDVVEGEQEDDDVDDTAARVLCVNLHKRESGKRGEHFSWEKYGLWRQEQKTTAPKLEKLLKARCTLEELIEEQLNRYDAYYNRAMVPIRLKNVAQILMPKWAPPYELATISWLGDWRPSAILDILRTLTRRSSLSFSRSLSYPVDIESVLAQMIHEIRIEEAVLDEEMAEIQATCVLHLPFAPMNKQSGPAALACLQSEFKKIERVITKAQHLRFKALELVVKKVLTQTDAVEFLVSFAGIKDTVHQFAALQRFRKGPVSLPVKALGVIDGNGIDRTLSENIMMR